MSKGKSKANLGKMVDAQAKGKTVKGARADKKKSGGSELDSRASKAFIIKY